MTLSAFTVVLVVLVCLAVFADPAYAFGAGNIPANAVLEGKAFRHGDLEEFLGDIFGYMSTEAFKKIYFGNWLRDYSQAMDVTLMNHVKGDVDSILTIVMLLGFKEFPSGAGAYKVTSERLRVYLPVEHIDNPKGYLGKAGLEGQFSQWAYNNLRSEWTQAELAIDPKNGMKQYIATKGSGWQTSWKTVYDRLLESVRIMRDQPTQEQVDDALRLLGDALHTLEDFTAHSNWIELCLIKMGNVGVFPMVGDDVRVEAPDGRSVPPLVTGSFGALDLMHSLASEGSDKASQGTIGGFKFRTDGTPVDTAPLRALLNSALLKQGSTKQKEKLDTDVKLLDELATFQAEGNNAGQLNIILWQIFEVHADINKTIDDVLEAMGVNFLKAGFNELKGSIERLFMDIVSEIAAPFLTAGLTAIKEASDEIAAKQNQEQNVFTDPECSDPSHSQLAKDHFIHCLNEPAGLVAKAIVGRSAKIMKELYHDHDLDAGTMIKDEILSCLFHPMFVGGKMTAIQTDMIGELQKYLNGMSQAAQSAMIETLGKQQVLANKHHRLERQGLDQAPSSSILPSPGQVIAALANPLPSIGNAVQGAKNLRGYAEDYNTARREAGEEAWKMVKGWFS